MRKHNQRQMLEKKEKQSSLSEPELWSALVMSTLVTFQTSSFCSLFCVLFCFFGVRVAGESLPARKTLLVLTVLPPAIWHFQASGSHHVGLAAQPGRFYTGHFRKSDYEAWDYITPVSVLFTTRPTPISWCTWLRAVCPFHPERWMRRQPHFLHGHETGVNARCPLLRVLRSEYCSLRLSSDRPAGLL